jgi:hypothetical protein
LIWLHRRHRGYGGQGIVVRVTGVARPLVNGLWSGRLVPDPATRRPTMFIQIALGTCLMLLSILIAGLSFWAMELSVFRLRHWLAREPHRPKLILILCIAAFWILAQVTAGVWIWAVALRMLGLFPTLELSVYFALTAYTTLGFGDVLLPEGWRLLGGMAAANGLLNFGLLTAVLVEALRVVRIGQIDSLRGRK